MIAVYFLRRSASSGYVEKSEMSSTQMTKSYCTYLYLLRVQ